MTEAEFIDPWTNESEQEEERTIYLVTKGLKSPYTERAYRLAFNNFLKRVGNPSLKTLLDTKLSVIESKIIGYVETLKTQKLSYSTIQVHCAAIFHFFEINDVNLNTRKIKRFLPQDESDYYSTDRPYSINEIERILSKCDIRSRVIIQIMASTGMRLGGLRELQLGDIKKIDEFGLYMIWVYNRSRKERYYTFCTRECAAAIDSYLDYRKSFGEELKRSAPLIREQFNIDNPFVAKVPKFVSLRMMSFIFEDLLKRSGVNQIQPGNSKRDVMSSHGLRKFFINQCIRAGLTESMWKPLVGHKLPKTDTSYIRVTIEERLAQYIKVVDFLTINPNQRLKARVEELESEKSHKIAMLEARIQQQDEWLDKYKDSREKSERVIETMKSILEKKGFWKSE